VTLRAAAFFSAVAFVAAFVVTCLFEGGCVPTDRAAARGAVTAAARATRSLDEVCAQFALERRDVGLARECADAYRATRIELVEAAQAIDRWSQDEDRELLVCAVAHAGGELVVVARVLRRHGAQVPPDIDEVISAISSWRCAEDIEVR